MFNARRAPVTLGVAFALVCALSVSAGAATPSSGSSPTSVGASGSTAPSSSTTLPAAFTLPTDVGLQLVQQQNKAKTDLAANEVELPLAKQHVIEARQEATLAKRQLVRLKASAASTQDKLDASREHLREVAAQAYIHAGDANLAAAISSLTSAKSAVDVASKLHMISTYGSSERDALEDFVSLKERVDRQAAQIADLSTHSDQIYAQAQQHVVDVQNGITDATARLAASVTGIAEFEAAATSALSPILGPSQLAANQMADYITSQGYKPRITVPIRDLAQAYLDEGAKTGVRGDVAFAQSILETGGFANPGSSATDNNFAGIGWCDSCAHGYNFPDAQTGVRAQLQLLRIYVDPAFPQADYTDPILLPGTLKLGFRGKVATWWDLWGTWATAALYGQRVYDIYTKMVAFAATDPAQPAIPLTPPPPPKPGSPPTTVGRPPGSGPGTKT